MPKTPNLGNYRRKPTVMQFLGAWLKWFVLLVVVVGGFLYLYASISIARRESDHELERSKRLNQRW
jgi:hypothetical protein